MARDASHRAALGRHQREDTAVVLTPLDLITILEQDECPISTVVLTGNTSARRELAMFVLDTYPWVHLIDERQDSESDAQMSACV